jgi:hypothetical protein
MEGEWKDRLEGSERTKRLQKIDAEYPSLKFSTNTAILPRQHYAALVQLRLGHFPTAAYLKRVNKEETARCKQCNQRTETVQHYLMDCEAYAS